MGEARHANPGKAPTRWPKDAMVRIWFRNGRAGKQPYPAHGLRWSLTGDPWDIIEFSRCKDV